MNLDLAVHSRPLETLRTERLRLEPLEETHASALFAGLSDGALYGFISDHAPASVDALANRFRRLATRMSPDGRESWLNWALWSLPDSGYVGLVQATIRPDRTAYIAYILFREAWGRGYAREASAAAIASLYLDWGVREIWATVDIRNHRSIALLEKLGFLRVALRRSAEVIRGTPSDDFVYCLLLDAPVFPFLSWT